MIAKFPARYILTDPDCIFNTDIYHLFPYAARDAITVHTILKSKVHLSKKYKFVYMCCNLKEEHMTDLFKSVSRIILAFYREKKPPTSKGFYYAIEVCKMYLGYPSMFNMYYSNTGKHGVRVSNIKEYMPYIEKDLYDKLEKLIQDKIIEYELSELRNRGRRNVAV